MAKKKPQRTKKQSGHFAVVVVDEHDPDILRTSDSSVFDSEEGAADKAIEYSYDVDDGTKFVVCKLVPVKCFMIPKERIQEIKYATEDEYWET